ncbi:AmmeMemoRadiSam system protein B [Candidatus Peregrinibacteria bacterium]|jgi:MEMO1 family protein|nr:AmmeMemoRadiSam system protein B [Candidatus Peregrinibacteria bacterium]
MSLVFAAVVPHPTLLIPSIGKDDFMKLDATREALEKLEQDLYLAKPQHILIITPHEGIFEDAFSVNAHTELHSQFETFGDMTTKYSWKGAPTLAAKIQHKANKLDIPTRLVSNEYIGHGASIPLAYLTTHVKDINILPIGYSNLDTKAHTDFGHLIKDVIMESDQRIAVIASGDMSHTLTEKSPSGIHKDGAWFDEEVQKLLQAGDRQELKNIDAARIKNANECLYRSLLILCGLLGNMQCDFEQYAYESPFGVGYLTGQFHI